MFCDFRKAFGLDPEYNKQLEESMQEAEKKALKEKWCCTCEYYIPVDPNLPGFVVAYPECEKGRNPMQSCEEYRRKGYAMVSKEEEKRMKQDSAGQFSQCNRCGARIMWVKTKAGKNMPVDPQFVDFKKIKGGKERLVLPNGEVVAGERCKAKEADGYGYISHFATCPGYRR